MATDSADHVSQTLREGGLSVPPTSLFIKKNSIRVQTSHFGQTIRSARRAGLSMVYVIADFESPRLTEEKVQAIIDVLAAAGYRAERNLDARIVDVWELDWQSYLASPAA